MIAIIEYTLGARIINDSSKTKSWNEMEVPWYIKRHNVNNN